MTAEELKKLYDKRASVWDDAKKLNDAAGAEKRDLSPEEQQTWDRMQVDITAMSSQIERANFVRDTEARIAAGNMPERNAAPSDAHLSRPTVSRDEQISGRARIAAEENRAFQGWSLQVAGHHDKVTDEHRAAAQRTGHRLDAEFFDLPLAYDYDRLRRRHTAEKRALGVSSEPEIIPEGFVSSLEQSMLAFGGMRDVATVIRTPTGNDLPWPTSNDTGNTGELVAEATGVAAADPVIAALTLKAWKFSSKKIIVSTELMQDQGINFAGLIGGMMGERLARIQNTNFTTGTDGTTEPLGVVVGSSAGVTHDISVSGTALLPDSIIDLIHSVDPSYRSQPGAGFMMHDSIVAIVRKLKELTSGGNQYLWQPGMQVGVPDRLLGYPITINQDMDSTIIATDIPIVFGALRKYIIRDVASIRVRRLSELLALSDQEAFIAFQRSDGRILDAGTDPIKHMVFVA